MSRLIWTIWIQKFFPSLTLQAHQFRSNIFIRIWKMFYLPNKFFAMWTECWLTQERCHKFVSIDLKGERSKSAVIAWYCSDVFEKRKFIVQIMIFKIICTWCTRLRIAPRRRLNAARSLNSGPPVDLVLVATAPCVLLWSIGKKI